MGAHELSERGMRILKEARSLPPEERVELADQLIFTLEPEYLRRVEEAWAKEAEARLDAYDRGETIALPSDLAVEMAKAAARKRTRRTSPRRRKTE
ncbi:MAG: addiction module protein [Planctomycetes bacterium]|nr:addiction module protein [Planctomycetota bacterium]